MADRLPSRLRPGTFRTLEGYNARTSYRGDRQRLYDWPPYESVRSSDRLLSRRFESGAKELVTVVGALNRSWGERTKAIAFLKDDPHAIQIGGDPLDPNTAAMLLTWRNAVAHAPKRTRHNKPGQGDLISKLGLDRKAIVAYVKQLRRVIIHASRAALKMEGRIQSQLSVSEHLLEHTELYTCKCGCFQSHATAGCDLCGKRRLGNPAAAILGGTVFVELIEKGIYLELGVSRLLERHGFRVLTGAHVRGLSGIDHEIDVVAKSAAGKVSLIIEVTRRPVDRRELADLTIRRADIPTSAYALVSAGPVDKDCAMFAKAHRIALFGSIQEDPDRLVDWASAVRREHGAAVQEA